MTKDELDTVLNLHRELVNTQRTLDEVRKVLRIPNDVGIVDGAREIAREADKIGATLGIGRKEPLSP